MKSWRICFPISVLGPIKDSLGMSRRSSLSYRTDVDNPLMSKDVDTLCHDRCVAFSRQWFIEALQLELRHGWVFGNRSASETEMLLKNPFRHKTRYAMSTIPWWARPFWWCGWCCLSWHCLVLIVFLMSNWWVSGNGGDFIRSNVSVWASLKFSSIQACMAALAQRK